MSNPDVPMLNAISAYLEHTHEIDGRRIRHDHYLLLNRKDCTPLGLYARISENIVKESSITHQPDISILSPSRKEIMLIIELDGGSHLTQEGRKRTILRNSHYRHSKIPFVAINTVKYRGDHSGLFRRIDSEVKKHHI